MRARSVPLAALMVVVASMTTVEAGQPFDDAQVEGGCSSLLLGSCDWAATVDTSGSIEMAASVATMLDGAGPGRELSDGRAYLLDVIEVPSAERVSVSFTLLVDELSAERPGFLAASHVYVDVAVTYEGCAGTCRDGDFRSREGSVGPSDDTLTEGDNRFTFEFADPDGGSMPPAVMRVEVWIDVLASVLGSGEASAKIDATLTPIVVTTT